jgi:hypothetical protein
MRERRGWVRRFLNWFRGDELDRVLDGGEEACEPRPTIGAAFGERPETPSDAVSAVGTAVMDAPSPAVIRRALLDGDMNALDRAEIGGAPPEADLTVDEDYVLTHEADQAAQTPETTPTRESVTGDGVALTREPVRPEDAILAKVDQGVGEVTRVLMNVSTAVVQESEVLEGLAKAMSDVPGIVRAQGMYLETITRQLEVQNARGAELAGRLKDLPALLGGVSEQGRAQVEFLQRMAAVLDGEADRANALVRSVNALGTVLETISETSRAQVRVLHELDRGQQAMLDAVQTSADRHSKRYAWLLSLMWTVTVATVGGMAFLVYYVTRHLPIG